MKLTVPPGSVSMAGSGMMTSSHPISASTPEGSSYGAIGTVYSRTGAQGGRLLPGVEEGTFRVIKHQRRIKLQATLGAFCNY